MAKETKNSKMTKEELNDLKAKFERYDNAMVIVVSFSF